MRRLYRYSTLLFWLLLAALWAAARWLPASGEPPVATVEPTTATTTTAAIDLAQLARHGTPNDCWMAIRGEVYDLSAYLPSHPSRPEVIEPWCGKEASEAYNTKSRGRRHSAAADQLLGDYRIGRLGDK
jgi:cytochrome b involved in lipid metabolism